MENNHSTHLVSKITHQSSPNTGDFKVPDAISYISLHPHCEKYPNHLFTCQQAVSSISGKRA